MKNSSKNLTGGHTQESLNKPYVIVQRKETGQAFSLKRDYTIFEEDLGIIPPPARYVESWDGWLPCFDWQRPQWVNNLGSLKMITKYFKAYWMY